MEKENKSNKSILWIVLFTFITVILCYLFVVLYFFFISPYNIALKLQLWPFLSQSTTAQLHMDASVEIFFKAWDEKTLNYVDESVVGVIVREDGFVIAPYTPLQTLDENSHISISTNFGKVYDGKMLYSDAHYNIAMLKCENIGVNEEIKLPYAKIGSSENISENSKILAISSLEESKNSWMGSVTQSEPFTVYSTLDVGGFDTIEYVFENCFSASFDEDFAGGAIFDCKGSVLGFSYDGQLSDGDYVLIPADGAKMFFDDVVEAYENEQQYDNALVKSFVGFDALELYCYMEYGAMTEGDDNQFFYFNKNWQPFTDSIVLYHIMQNNNQEFFYLFEDFKFNDVVIEKCSLITSVGYDGKEFKIYSTLDLLQALYNAKDTEVEIGFLKFIVEDEENKFYSDDISYVTIAV